MAHALRLRPCGDRSLLVYLGDTISPEVNAQVHALARALRQKNHPAVVDATPSYHALLVEFDPVRIRPEQLEELILSAAAATQDAPAQPGRTVEIPVCYGGEYGPDLDTVAAHALLTPEAVVQQHSAHPYRVHALGFSPGFPFLGDLDAALNTPRLADPRTVVPAGSVGIGGNQTGIYPAPSPGGWQLIGRTPADLFDPFRDPPALLMPGDSVRFVPIPAKDFAEPQRPVGPGLPAYAEGKTGLRILQTGGVATIQDLGRRGHMSLGVPLAGASDFVSLMVGNWLLGNRARTSALEIALTGPEVEFTGPLAFCITGAPIPAELIPANGGSPRQVPGWTTLLASPGDRLRIGTATAGCRSYLCVAGGFDLPPVLGSLSEDLFGKIGPLGRPVRAGDWLPVGLPLQPPADLAGRALPQELLPPLTGQVTLRTTRGPQADAFTDAALDTFFSGTYVVEAQSDRQGLRLTGPRLSHSGSPDILSEPVPIGSIQVPASGQPILLLGNRQTMGGYTKIGVTVYPDLALAGQLRPGDRVQFQEVDVAEAHAIAWAERRRLAQIRRYLEREVGRNADTMPAKLPVPVQAPAAAPVEAETPSPTEAAPQPAAQPGAPAAARTFRITIADVEFEAEVEEVLD